MFATDEPKRHAHTKCALQMLTCAVQVRTFFKPMCGAPYKWTVVRVDNNVISTSWIFVLRHI